WLAPTPYRGKRNEPSYIVHVASVLAKLKGVTVDDIGKATTKNFLNLFKVKLK
ncbi:MAG: TatD family hydrolase, partial [Alphaproteobacteria bacterium]|nr:TatD family hydrolase [Alphaproteobacteria bacterium]